MGSTVGILSNENEQKSANSMKHCKLEKLSRGYHSNASKFGLSQNSTFHSSYHAYGDNCDNDSLSSTKIPCAATTPDLVIENRHTPLVSTASTVIEVMIEQDGCGKQYNIHTEDYSNLETFHQWTSRSIWTAAGILMDVTCTPSNKVSSPVPNDIIQSIDSLASTLTNPCMVVKPARDSIYTFDIPIPANQTLYPRN